MRLSTDERTAMPRARPVADERIVRELEGTRVIGARVVKASEVGDRER